MKKINFLIAMTALTIMLVISSCSTMIKVADPCSGKKYFTDKEYYRARFMGTSVLEDVALKAAKNNSRQELASIMKIHVQKVGEDYLKQKFNKLDENVAKDFQEMIISVVDEMVYDSYSICEEALQDRKTKSYKYYVVLETPKSIYTTKLAEEMQKDNNLRFDYDKKLFEEVFKKYID